MSGSPAAFEQILDKNRSTGMPVRREMTLSKNRYSLYVTIMKEAWEDAGIDPDEPGAVDQYYYPDEGVVVLDMAGHDDE